MIDLTLSIDIDDPKSTGTSGRRIETTFPPGYAVKARCSAWGRTLEDGCIEMDYHLRVKTPPGVLPRILV